MARFAEYEVLYSDESSFAEVSTSYSALIPCLEVSGLNLTQERSVTDGAMQSRMNVRAPGYAGVREGEFTLRCPLGGHGTTTAGALTADWLHDLLSDALGGGDATTIGDAIDSASTTTSLGITGGTITRGSVVRVGASGDTRSEGRAAVIADGSKGLLTALPTGPNSGDVVYAALMAYPTESLGTTKRFCIGHKPSGAQWHVRGCHAKAARLMFPIGGLPEVELTYHAAYWVRDAVSIPSGTTRGATPRQAPIAGQDIYYQTVGTTTRAVLSATEVSLNLEMQLGIHRTTGATAQFQVITGYERGPITASLDITLQDWVTAYETFWDLDGGDSVYKHILFESCRTDGRAVGFYLPKCYAAGPRPTREAVNDTIGVRIRLEAIEGPDTTSDLTRSAVRIWRA